LGMDGEMTRLVRLTGSRSCIKSAASTMKGGWPRSVQSQLQLASWPSNREQQSQSRMLNEESLAKGGRGLSPATRPANMATPSWGHIVVDMLLDPSIHWSALALVHPPVSWSCSMSFLLPFRSQSLVSFERGLGGMWYHRLDQPSFRPKDPALQHTTHHCQYPPGPRDRERLGERSEEAVSFPPIHTIKETKEKKLKSEAGNPEPPALHTLLAA
jgi:hypothetical protein